MCDRIICDLESNNYSRIEELKNIVEEQLSNCVFTQNSEVLTVESIVIESLNVCFLNLIEGYEGDNYSFQGIVRINHVVCDGLELESMYNYSGTLKDIDGSTTITNPVIVESHH